MRTKDILRPPSGTSSAWVIIRGEGPERPVLAARDNLAAAVILNGASYVRLEHLEITHDDQAIGSAAFFRDGIQAFDEPIRQIVFRDLSIHHLDEFGINLQDAEDLQIIDCRFRLEYCLRLGEPWTSAVEESPGFEGTRHLDLDGAGPSGFFRLRRCD